MPIGICESWLLQRILNEKKGPWFYRLAFGSLDQPPAHPYAPRPRRLINVTMTWYWLSKTKSKHFPQVLKYCFLLRLSKYHNSYPRYVSYILLSILFVFVVEVEKTDRYTKTTWYMELYLWLLIRDSALYQCLDTYAENYALSSFDTQKIKQYRIIVRLIISLIHHSCNYFCRGHISVLSN